MRTIMEDICSSTHSTLNIEKFCIAYTQFNRSRNKNLVTALPQLKCEDLYRASVERRRLSRRWRRGLLPQKNIVKTSYSTLLILHAPIQAQFFYFTLILPAAILRSYVTPILINLAMSAVNGKVERGGGKGEGVETGGGGRVRVWRRGQEDGQWV